jgi:hypothetical protein
MDGHLSVAEDSHALAAFVPSSAAPVITTTSPADNATALPITANLVATFSEPVVKRNRHDHHQENLQQQHGRELQRGFLRRARPSADRR